MLYNGLMIIATIAEEKGLLSQLKKGIRIINDIERTISNYINIKACLHKTF